MKAWSHKPWDLLLADSLSTGATLVAEVTGCAWASASVTPLAMPSRSLPPSRLAIAPGEGRLNRVRNAALRALFRTLTTGVHHAYNQTRAAVGLPATRIRLDTGWFSRELICVIGIPELDYPRADLPPQVHYVGAVRSAVAGSQQFPEWWSDVVAETRPIVHVTQGTQDLNPNDLLRPALAALSGHNVLVIASTGIRDRNELPFPVPANARVWGLLPCAQLLPRTRLMVTNGGWGAALDALSHGIPIVVAGGDIDKPEIAARLAYSGVAIDLRTGTPTAAQIGTAVTEILSDARYAERAGVISSHLAALDGAAETRRLVENLIGQRARSS